MFLDEMKKEDMDLILEFDKKIIDRLDDSTFGLALGLVERIIKKLDPQMTVQDYQNKIIKFKFDDITFMK